MESQVEQWSQEAGELHAAAAALPPGAPGADAVGERQNAVGTRIVRLIEPLKERRRVLLAAKELQQVGHELEDELLWVQERLPLASQQDVGSDLQSVQLQLKKNQERAERRQNELDAAFRLQQYCCDVSDVEAWLGEQELLLMGDDKGKLRRLQERAERRQNELDAAFRLQQYCCDVSDVEAWLGEQELLLMGDDKGKDEQSTLQLLQKLLRTAQTVENYADTIAQLSRQCRSLLEMGHPQSEELSRRQSRVDRLYVGLKELLEERKAALEQQWWLQQLGREVGDLEHWIAEKEVVAGSPELGQDYEHVTQAAPALVLAQLCEHMYCEEELGAFIPVYLLWICCLGWDYGLVTMGLWTGANGIVGSFLWDYTLIPMGLGSTGIALGLQAVWNGIMGWSQWDYGLVSMGLHIDSNGIGQHWDCTGIMGCLGWDYGLVTMGLQAGFNGITHRFQWDWATLGLHWDYGHNPSPPTPQSMESQVEQWSQEAGELHAAAAALPPGAPGADAVGERQNAVGTRIVRLIEPLKERRRVLLAAKELQQVGHELEDELLLQEKFLEFASETGNVGQERISAVNQMVDELIDYGHADAATIAEWKDGVNEAWADLLELMETRAQLLAASHELHKFFSDCRELLGQIEEKRRRLPELTHEPRASAGGLQRALGAFERDVEVLVAQVRQLQEGAAQLRTVYAGDNAEAIAKREQEVLKAWKELLAACEEGRLRVADAAERVRFVGAAKELLAWICLLYTSRCV
ncbi:UNVERIFIED_CONTAM: hypothetical protein H355_000382 [Colinus virginianus]|nr:hypothetical protein H355_000382 [Colinus virginianus]